MDRYPDPTTGRKRTSKHRDKCCSRRSRASTSSETLTIANDVHLGFSSNPYRVGADDSKTSADIDASRTGARRRHRGNSDHRYWCTVCGLENPHSYQGRDDWKTHEKAHETTFDCLPNRRIEQTAEGSFCTFCGRSEPDDLHFQEHNVEACSQAPHGPPSFKRRYEMVSHLRDHHKCTNSEVLAEKWRSMSLKRAWSCGFCVALFRSLPDRLKHIGTEHFEHHQTLDKWSPTNVIQGLLLQPKIKEAWQRYLETLDPVSREDLIWCADSIHSLQQQLEMGVTTIKAAEDLVREAYKIAEFDWMPNIAISSLANYRSTNFVAPSPIANRVKKLNKLCGTVFIKPAKGLHATETSLLANLSSSENWPFEGATGTSTECSSIISPDSKQTPVLSIDEWSGTYSNDDRGPVNPFNDKDGNNQLYRPLETFMDYTDAIPKEFTFGSLTNT